VLIDVSKVGGRTETWRNATTYAEYILDTASQWSVFNDVDGIRGNIRWHAPRTSSRAGIQLWEQGNPLYDRSNLDGDEELERSDDYDSYAELKQEWCRETPYEC
ncbi:hypothetical protein RBH26_21040, partial [Natronolimnohabitans sp. A-GB9]|uniref:hypothetical protein n=1 Tax=Natronolimnohabitans sp. A-GB9 TaxID=3069757 RepID=UPI0027AEC576